MLEIWGRKLSKAKNWGFMYQSQLTWHRLIDIKRPNYWEYLIIGERSQIFASNCMLRFTPLKNVYQRKYTIQIFMYVMLDSVSIFSFVNTLKIGGFFLITHSCIHQQMNCTYSARINCTWWAVLNCDNERFTQHTTRWKQLNMKHVPI